MSFFIFVVKSNVIPLKNTVKGFAKICRLFLIEKRVKPRKLQLQMQG